MLNEEREDQEGGNMMEIKSPKIKALIIAGIIGISITAMALDFTGGKEIALFGIGGLVGLTKVD